MGGNAVTPPPLLSYAVANTATCIFEAACEYEKSIEKDEIFKWKYCIYNC